MSEDEAAASSAASVAAAAAAVAAVNEDEDADDGASSVSSKTSKSKKTPRRTRKRAVANEGNDATGDGEPSPDSGLSAPSSDTAPPALKRPRRARHATPAEAETGAIPPKDGKAEVRSDAEDDDAGDGSDDAAHMGKILADDHAWVTSRFWDFFGPRLIALANAGVADVSDASGIVYVSPTTAENVMSMHLDGRLTEDTIHVCMGVDKKLAATAGLIIIPIHGPHTVLTKRAGRALEQDVVNDHWSLLAVAPRSNPNMYVHYDSMAGHENTPSRNTEVATLLASILNSKKFIAGAHTVAVSHPDFYPMQGDLHSCGFRAMTSLYLMANSATRCLLTDDTVKYNHRWYMSPDLIKETLSTMLVLGA